MPALKLQTRFLLRATVLLTGLLIVWWFVLQSPMRALLKASAQACGGLAFGIPASKLLTEAANGDWTFEIPLDFSSGPVQYHSINFDLARSDVSAFTFSLPVYWAIMMALPWAWRSRRALIQGTLLMGALEIILLLVFAQILAHKLAAQMAHSQDATTSWLLHFGNSLVLIAIPYVAPFVAAIWLHPELKRQMFGAAPFAQSVAVSGNDAASPSRQKRQQ